MPPALLVLGAAGMVLWGVGCGGEGVTAGATVRVYAGADVCAEAQRALAGGGGDVGDVEVEAVCLAPTGRPGSLDLATIGANARRATQDSSTIGFVESSGPANRFARTIVEEAGIAYVPDPSGSSATKRILKAVEEAGSGSLRDEVREALESE
ncbi:MAG TPA: hypothetical protein VLL27_12130 [Solirubrobacterales bacterium]|nr:hypothetical protein [Solirubrobacterales bacterium]